MKKATRLADVDVGAYLITKPNGKFAVEVHAPYIADVRVEDPEDEITKVYKKIICEHNDEELSSKKGGRR